ncbi:MAG TPA: FAD-dependent oxidoreductase [Candidatus Binatia bacterium]|nr:FAD-dependent oxidoreductase [Candidatus Binatia bacterium]
MSDSRTFVVAGASLAGLRACEALREEGFEGRLVLVGAERHDPYDRPPLSKEILRGQWQPARTTLRKNGLADLNLDLRLGRAARYLDAATHTLTLDDDETIVFDGLVIATGARVRTLDDVPPLAGVHYLRTLDDAVALRDELLAGPRVAVIGAGFIGCEVAASARALDLDVTLIEPLAAPMVRALGRALGGLAARLHADNGIDLRCARRMVAIQGGDRVERLHLSDGSVVRADVVVIGVGVQPQTQWLEGSGLELEDGVVCDDRCATAVDGIVAAGDVARWNSPRAGRLVRIEHWTNAAAQGRAAALRLLKGADSVEPYAPVPYVWSDQFGIKLQMAGHALPDDELHVVDGSFEEYRFVALFGRGGRLTGVAGMGRPRIVAHYQGLLEEGAELSRALATRPA